MLKVVVIAILIFVSYNISTAQSKNMDKLEKRLEELKIHYAPDSRTAIFEYSIDKINKKVTVRTDKPEAAKKLSVIRGSLSGFDLKLILLPGEELGDKAFGVINLSVANLRKEPKHSSELVSQALLGTPIRVLERKGEWFRVQTPDEYISWTDDDAVSLMDFLTYDAWKQAKKIIYTNEFGFSFSKANSNSQRVSDLVIGNILKLIKRGNGFYQVEYPDRRVAFIPEEECVDYEKWIKQNDADPSEIVNTAYRFLGLPYLWGGTSSKGVDCSGFTKTVFYLNGIMLPRDASQQVLVGETVDTKNGFGNLKPGDLLFFGKKVSENSPEKVTHVGIYIGNSEFIHSSGKVKVNSLDPKAENFNEYRYRTFLRAKRILNSLNKNGVQTVDNNRYYAE